MGGLLEVAGDEVSDGTVGLNLEATWRLKNLLGAGPRNLGAWSPFCPSGVE